jgi:cobalt-zinc-cadmium resistance protein CzcA
MQLIVGAAIRQRILVMILAVLMIAGGLFAYKQLNIEAYPDPVPPLVDIVTQNPGQSSEEIERYITIPIESADGGTALCEVDPHSISLTGLSDVKVQFTYDLTYREAAQLVTQPAVAARSVAQWRAARSSRRQVRSARSSAIA